MKIDSNHIEAFRKLIERNSKNWLDTEGKFLSSGDLYGVFILTFPLKADRDVQRRNENPLLFSALSKRCFCDFKKKNKILFPLSINSSIFFRLREQKALFYSSSCNPELFLDHFIDIQKLLHEINQFDLLLFFNLPGSGASIPQHAHGQILPINTKQPKCSFYRLIENIESKKKLLSVKNGIKISEFDFPMWGLEITFPEDYPAYRKGEILYLAIQKEIRLRSQLRLSYNIYFRSNECCTVRIIFRLCEIEIPFKTSKIQTYIKKWAGHPLKHSSNNFHWRWGGLEALGGLPTRDQFFRNTSLYDFQFWKGFYELLNEWLVPYRENIINQIITAIKKS